MNRRMSVFAAMLLGACSGRALDVVPVEPVWSAHPVGFDLLTHAPRQFVVYYDAQRRMTVAQRELGSTNWAFTRLPSTLGWDSHNYVTIAADREGFLHVSGNMHCVPLVYFRSTKPWEAASLVPAAMTGEREKRVTYPVFFNDRAGRLVFRYRDGSSGSGDDIYNVYEEATKTWRRLLPDGLLSGLGEMNAYSCVPKRGPNGKFHMVWVWRDTPDCASNHDLSYACSPDLEHWFDAAGRALTLPITIKNSDIVDPVPVRGGLINVNRELGFDPKGRAVITYHKYDAAGDLQAYAARFEEGAWKTRQISDWKGYRWEFGGGGTIVGEVRIGEARVVGTNRLAVDYRYPHGSGTWLLDGDTLQVLRGEKAAARKSIVPPQFQRVESTFPGMKKKVAEESADDQASARGYALLWETLEPNRDRPRVAPLPEPSLLRVIETEKGER